MLQSPRSLNICHMVLLMYKFCRPPSACGVCPAACSITAWLSRMLQHAGIRRLAGTPLPKQHERGLRRRTPQTMPHCRHVCLSALLCRSLAPQLQPSARHHSSTSHRSQPQGTADDLPLASRLKQLQSQQRPPPQLPSLQADAGDRPWQGQVPKGHRLQRGNSSKQAHLASPPAASAADTGALADAALPTSAKRPAPAGGPAPKPSPRAVLQDSARHGAQKATSPQRPARSPQLPRKHKLQQSSPQPRQSCLPASLTGARTRPSAPASCTSAAAMCTSRQTRTLLRCARLSSSGSSRTRSEASSGAGVRQTSDLWRRPASKALPQICC